LISNRLYFIDSQFGGMVVGPVAHGVSDSK